MYFIQHNWPLLLISAWFIWRIFNSWKIRKNIPILLTQGAIIVDVRSSSEFLSGHSPRSINIPLNELPTKLGELPKDKPLILCCASGTRSGMARLLLKKNGFKNVYNLGRWSQL